MQTTKQELEGNLPGQRTATNVLSSTVPQILASSLCFLEQLDFWNLTGIAIQHTLRMNPN